MIEFSDCSGCKECPLWEIAKHPGLPTRTHTSAGHKQALLIVGQSPGLNEDKKGESWVGYSGQLLDKFIEASGIPKYADVYLSNVCRCLVPQDSKPTRGQINKCRKNLLADVQILTDNYEKVTILACGSFAVYGVSHMKSLTMAVKKQGVEESALVNAKSPAPALFFTYHPALLHPSRKPAKVHAVEAHFMLLVKYLKGEFIPNDMVVKPEVGIRPPKVAPPLVCLDIETYGILKGREQTVFHPVKSREIDGVEYRDQVVTVSFGFWEKDRVRTLLYQYDKPQHRKYIEQWIKRIVQDKSVLLGQYIKFDLLYLKTVNKVINYWADPRWLRLDDTLLMSFLLYEQRPEKGLKELSTLFGIADYNNLSVTGSSGTAKNSSDPALHYYNCLDVAATLHLYKEIWKRIKDKYGPDSAKLTKVCADARNVATWDTLNLEENGCAMDVWKLQERYKLISDESLQLYTLLEKSGITATGTGSEKSLREFLGGLLIKCCLNDDPRVMYTEKRKQLSIKKENVNLLLEYLPEGVEREMLQELKRLRECDKELSTYLGPLLTKKRKGIVTFSNRVGMTYPSWYPIPSYANRGGGRDEKAGGTIQGRFACSKPPAQTYPSQIVDCMTTRFKPGKLVGWDLSQIELRMAGLQSGDSLLLENYAQGGDLHTQTALIIYPSIDEEIDFTSAEWKDGDERYLGKTTNFLVLYRGGALKLQETARLNGLNLSIEFCREVITTWYAAHQEFKEWQDNLIRTAGQGYIELVTGWSRTFGLGVGGNKAYINEICNFPIQTLSAQLLQSAEFKILQRFREERLRSVIACQVHDSLVFDIRHGEDEIVEHIVNTVLTRPPLLSILEDTFGRTVPIKFDKKVYTSYGYKQSA